MQELEPGWWVLAVCGLLEVTSTVKLISFCYSLSISQDYPPPIKRHPNLLPKRAHRLPTSQQPLNTRHEKSAQRLF
jgi:hypothetical protein